MFTKNTLRAKKEKQNSKKQLKFRKRPKLCCCKNRVDLGFRRQKNYAWNLILAIDSLARLTGTMLKRALKPECQGASQKVMEPDDQKKRDAKN